MASAPSCHLGASCLVLESNPCTIQSKMQSKIRARYPRLPAAVCRACLLALHVCLPRDAFRFGNEAWILHPFSPFRPWPLALGPWPCSSALSLPISPTIASFRRPSPAAHLLPLAPHLTPKQPDLIARPERASLAVDQGAGPVQSASVSVSFPKPAARMRILQPK